MKVRTEKKIRLPPSTFNLPVEEIRCGFNSAVYFWRTKRILEQDRKDAAITHQVFQKKDDVTICGVDEAIAILKYGTGFFSDYEKALEVFGRVRALEPEIEEALANRNQRKFLNLTAKEGELRLQLDALWVDKFSEIEVTALFDGGDLGAWETAMLLEGDYALFAHLESLLLGVLARRTKIATNSRAVVQAAAGKPVLFFADRFDHFTMQQGDGYAAHLAGVAGVASNAMASWFDEQGMGTIPHAMIVAYKGDSVLAARKFREFYPQVNAISLVDFDNDCVNTALSAARELGENLWGVRLDTADNMVDRSLQEQSFQFDDEKCGVVPRLVEKVRNALDKEGFRHVKIIVSGGFNPGKISRFEEQHVPVDVYAVGSWILTGRFDFTADAVRLNGQNLAKVGREYRPNSRLTRV